MNTRYKRPDQKKNALSIIEAVKKDLRFTLTLPISPDAGPTIVRNVYEGFQMLADALLVAKGIKSTDHVAPVKKLLTLKVETPRPIQAIDNLRRLRHNINYYGYTPTEEEVKDVLSIAQSCFEPLLTEVQKKISQ